MFRDTCLVCGSNQIKRIIDLGMHPFADTFVSQEFLSLSEQVYPLQCDLCEECGQIQTSCVTNPYDRYSVRDYSYTSANSSFSKNHWKEYAEEVSKNVSLETDSLIVEIGSNDGYLLKQLKDLGFRNCIGIDPSTTMANEAKEKHGVETIVGLFEDVDLAYEDWKNFDSQCSLIIANNVFNHSNNPMDMLNGVAKLLKEDGYFVYELPYWLTLLKTNKFDQIYHEHISYFTATSSYNLLKKAGLSIVKIEVVDYHGGSLRVYAKKGESVISDELKQMMTDEHAHGVFDVDTYREYMNGIFKQRNKFMKNIYDIKLKGGSIVGVGAAAKGNTFLNFYNLDNSLLDCVTDSSRFKQGKFTPLTRIPIRGDEVFRKYNEVHAVILSWNIAEKLKEILFKINPKIKFITLKGNSNIE